MEECSVHGFAAWTGAADDRDLTRSPFGLRPPPAGALPLSKLPKVPSMGITGGRALSTIGPGDAQSRAPMAIAQGFYSPIDSTIQADYMAARTELMPKRGLRLHPATLQGFGVDPMATAAVVDKNATTVDRLASKTSSIAADTLKTATAKVKGVMNANMEFAKKYRSGRHSLAEQKSDVAKIEKLGMAAKQAAVVAKGADTIHKGVLAAKQGLKAAKGIAKTNPPMAAKTADMAIRIVAPVAASLRSGSGRYDRGTGARINTSRPMSYPENLTPVVRMKNLPPPRVMAATEPERYIAPPVAQVLSPFQPVEVDVSSAFSGLGDIFDDLKKIGDTASGLLTATGNVIKAGQGQTPGQTLPTLQTGTYPGVAVTPTNWGKIALVGVPVVAAVAIAGWLLLK